MRTYDTNTLAAIEALNAHVGEVLWYEFWRDEYRHAGGNVKQAAATLDRVVAAFPDSLRWHPVTKPGRLAVCQVEVMQKIFVKKFDKAQGEA